MTPKTRKVSPCPEKRRLSEAFVAAVHEVISLQSKEMQMAAHRGAGTEQLELALNAARRNRDSAKRAYDLHVELHGC